MRVQAQMVIPKIQESLRIDGKLTETIWSEPFAFRNFVQNFPTDTLAAKNETEVMLCYDDKHLYVAAKCYNITKAKDVVQSLKRDFSITRSDALVVSLSPINDKINGYSFGVNPFGVQREGLIANAGAFGVTTAWDNLWYCEVGRNGADSANANGYWVCEMRIPFSSLRFKKDNNEWGINIARIDMKTNETSVWKTVPLGFNVSHLGFAGSFQFEQPLQKSSRSFSWIPYVAGGAAYNNTEPGPPKIKNLAAAGFDAKVGVTSSLNLDLTVYPDFSQVEVDDQVINLDRFEVFFPERRQFFIENGDLFDQFGFSKIRPFFSRRIGLAQGQNIPIIGAARLSGNVNKDWRIGVMNLQTLSRNDLQIPAQNYTVAALQRRVFDRSNISLITVNQYRFDSRFSGVDNLNQVTGVDYNLYSKNNLWRGKFFYHHSFYGRKVEAEGGAQAGWLNFRNRQWDINWNHEYVGRMYKAETGFVPRTGYVRLEPYARYTFFPKSAKIFSHSFFVYYSQYLDLNTRKSTDRLNQLNYKMIFKSTAEFSVSYQEYQTLLQRDLRLSKDLIIPAGNYVYRGGTVSYLSDFRKPLSGNASADFGKFYDRLRWNMSAGGSYRFQPFGAINITAVHSAFFQPGSPVKHLVLVNSKLELSITRDIFFNAIVQYNTQANLLSSNFRLQWRFRPMSDLFFVYTEGYSGELQNQNRAFILKLVYWINPT